ncbi:MAG: DUF4340 domain-containing protein, partial [Sedimentisphaerales bacterium]|nr:DUF4340 domain-containing protein [Sedimentisphaerales bacterium]
MNDRKLSILAVATLFALVAAVIVSRITHTAGPPSIYGAHLIQGLDPRIIDSIKLGSGPTAVTIRRQDSRFVAVERDNYPVSDESLYRLISACLDAVVIQSISDSPENHPDLGVTESTARSVVRFYDAQHQPIVGLLIGSYTEQNHGNYVRLFDSDTVYLSSNLPFLSNDITDYFNKRLFRVDPAAIQRIEITTPQESYALIPTAPGVPTIESLPSNIAAKPEETQIVFNALTRFDFIDIHVHPQDAPPLRFIYSYTCQLNSGITYILEIAPYNDQYLLHTYARFNAVLAQLPQNADEDTQTQFLTNARLTAQYFNQTHAEWTYTLDLWQAIKLIQPLTELT